MIMLDEKDCLDGAIPIVGRVIAGQNGEALLVCEGDDDDEPMLNLPPLVPTNIVEGREQRVHMASPGPDRWKERSRFYPGIAKAMAEQWGGIISEDYPVAA